MKEKVKFVGTVLEVRIFRDMVFLFVKCELPKKVCGETVRFKFKADNCLSLESAARVAVGATVWIDRCVEGDKYVYLIDSTDDAISADLVRE